MAMDVAWPALQRRVACWSVNVDGRTMAEGSKRVNAPLRRAGAKRVMRGPVRTVVGKHWRSRRRMAARSEYCDQTQRAVVAVWTALDVDAGDALPESGERFGCRGRQRQSGSLESTTR